MRFCLRILASRKLESLECGVVIGEPSIQHANATSPTIFYRSLPKLLNQSIAANILQ
jgi:hypothetical protein